jgi:CspA family cold shock protein
MLGKCRWFSPEKGYGFIQGENGEDIFVHHSAIQMEGYRLLEENQQVEFETEMAARGPMAVNVVVLESELSWRQQQ